MVSGTWPLVASGRGRYRVAARCARCLGPRHQGPPGRARVLAGAPRRGVGPASALHQRCGAGSPERRDGQRGPAGPSSLSRSAHPHDRGRGRAPPLGLRARHLRLRAPTGPPTPVVAPRGVDMPPKRHLAATGARYPANVPTIANCPDCPYRPSPAIGTRGSRVSRILLAGTRATATGPRCSMPSRPERWLTSSRTPR
jgi:hypothetical protein